MRKIIVNLFIIILLVGKVFSAETSDVYSNILSTRDVTLPKIVDTSELSSTFADKSIPVLVYVCTSPVYIAEITCNYDSVASTNSYNILTYRETHYGYFDSADSLRIFIPANYLSHSEKLSISKDFLILVSRSLSFENTTSLDTARRSIIDSNLLYALIYVGLSINVILIIRVIADSVKKRSLIKFYKLLLVFICFVLAIITIVHFNSVHDYYLEITSLLSRKFNITKNSILLTALFLFILELTYVVIHLVKDELSECRISSSNIGTILVYFTYITFVLGMFNLSSLFGVILISNACISLIVTNVLKYYEKIDFKNINRKLFLILLILGTTFSFILVKAPVQYISLLNDKEGIAILPVKKVLSNVNTGITPGTVKVHNNLFANNYLVYTPMFPNIVNKSIYDFDANSSFIVLTDDVSRYISFLLDKPNLASIFRSQNPSRLLFVRSSDWGQDKIKINLETKKSFCNPADSDVFIKVNFYIGAYTNKQDKDLFVLPRCGTANITAKYESEVEFTTNGSRDYVLEFEGIESSNIQSIRLTNLNSSLSYFYIYDPRHSKVLAYSVKSSNQDALTNYVLYRSPEIKFNSTFDSVSKNIEALINSKLIKDYLILQTDKLSGYIYK